jgi:hypothetical protein
MEMVWKLPEQSTFDWNDYADFSGAKVWRAAALTMNIPPEASLKKSFLEDQTTAKEYKRRRSAIQNALTDNPGSSDEVLWLRDNPNSTEGPLNKIVSMKSVVAFAKKKGWPIPDEMTRIWGTAAPISSQRTASETKKSIALSKILAAVINERAVRNSTQGFKDVVKDIECDLKRIDVEMDRATINRYVQTAIEDHLSANHEIAKRLSRPINEKR